MYFTHAWRYGYTESGAASGGGARGASPRAQCAAAPPMGMAVDGGRASCRELERIGSLGQRLKRRRVHPTRRGKLILEPAQMLLELLDARSLILLL